MPTKSVVLAVVRHGVTAIGVLLTAAAAIGALNAEQAQSLATQVQAIASSFIQILTAIGVIMGVAGPILAGLSARKSAQMKSLNDTGVVKVVPAASTSAPALTAMPK